MKKGKKQVLGINWTAIFERRPDLAPPGYHETIEQLYKEKTNETLESES